MVSSHGTYDNEPRVTCMPTTCMPTISHKDITHVTYVNEARDTKT